jgi:hypothetical protein
VATQVGGGGKALDHWEGKAKRLREAIEEVLGEEARPGCPPRFSAERPIMALACETPPAPLTHWTQEDLAREVFCCQTSDHSTCKAHVALYFEGRKQRLLLQLPETIRASTVSLLLRKLSEAAWTSNTKVKVLVSPILAEKPNDLLIA